VPKSLGKKVMDEKGLEPLSLLFVAKAGRRRVDNLISNRNLQQYLTIETTRPKY